MRARDRPLVPVDAPDRERLAVLLRAAYVDARYSFGFDVSREDLEALAQYVGAFRARAERACQESLAELDAAARMVAGRLEPLERQLPELCARSDPMSAGQGAHGTHEPENEVSSCHLDGRPT